ncbi:hypothetical protein SRHO_G00003840 [Serrasalmus rhombeus]
MELPEEEILKLSSCGTEAAGTNAAGDLEKNKLLLRNLLEERGRGALVHAQYVQYNYMDAPTFFFFGLEKQHKEKKALNCLRLPDGTETSVKRQVFMFLEDPTQAAGWSSAPAEEVRNTEQDTAGENEAAGPSSSSVEGVASKRSGE